MYRKIMLLITCLIVSLAPVAVFAEDKDLGEGEAKVEVKERFESTGEIKIGVQAVDEKEGESAKFNEYRDIEDGFYLYKFSVEGVDNDNGRYIEFKGTNVGRDDQNLKLRGGGAGKWGVEAEWDEIPHNLSEKAKTPYDYQGNGEYTISGNAGITSITNPTGQFSNVATFLNNTVIPHSTDLGTQREKGSVALAYTPTSRLKFKLGYSDEKKEGTQITGAPLGSRPPNTVNVQLPEPVDYQTKDLKLEAEYNGKNFQALASYLISDFTNDTDSLTWQSMFFGATGANDYNSGLGAGNTVSTTGKMALAPDNRYQNTSLSVGVNLPLDSRLTATASVGAMKQDEELLPYSTSAFTSLAGAPVALPRSTADAEIKTTLYNVEYSINPLDSTNVHAFYRYYDLDNNTTQSPWQYETSDTLTADTGAGVVNKRVNLAYAYKKNNYGIDLSQILPAKLGSIGLGYEKEKTDRDFREADTEEDTYKASYRVMPIQWLSLKAKYLYGKRNADDYDYKSTNPGYWYTSSEYTAQKDNPLVNFGNTPDLRKYDVSDRERKQWNVSALLRPMTAMDLNLSYMQKKDDFDSDVTSTAIAGYDGAAATTVNYNTVGQQLGLLENKVNQYTVGLNYAPTDRVTLSANYGRDENESLQRGTAASEDDKYSGKGWADLYSAGGVDYYGSAYLWEAKTTDKTDTAGVGLGFVIIPDKLNFTTGYTYSRGTVAIEYSGYGTQYPLSSSTDATVVGDENAYKGFSSPEDVKHKQQTVNATLEYQATKNVVIGFGYMYDKYEISDWMQEPSGGWVGSSGSDYFLIDSAGDPAQDKWGSSLVSLGNDLSPGYENHVGMITLAYKW